jgi:anti-sigma-K factor RskA
MTQNSDSELDALLATYKLAEANPDLLSKIVAQAAITPQKKKSIFAWPQLQFLSDVIWRWEAAAFAALALLGFWIGAASFASLETRIVQPSSSSSSDAAYINTIIFGPTTWKEVTI